MAVENELKPKYPFFIKAPLVLLGLVLFFYILGDLSQILIPVALAALFSLLLNPVTNFFERKIPRAIAITLSILLAAALVGSILYFLSHETAAFTNSIPALKAKMLYLADELQGWTYEHFGMNIERQVQSAKHSLDTGAINMRSTLGSIMDVTSVVVLLPIYIFLILYYKPLLLDFAFRLFPVEHSMRVAEILGETKAAIQSYMTGLAIETVIVMAMNSVALLLLGVRSAILLGIIGGFLNLVPYLGGIIAIALPVLMATVTNDGYSTQFYIVISYLAIQFIDNHFLVPVIVSSKVKINALISIIVVLLGGALWGVAGMFLSIPFVAVCKIIFDRVDDLKAWGVLLGTDIPAQHAGVRWLARWEQILWRKNEAEKNQHKEMKENRKDATDNLMNVTAPAVPLANEGRNT